jgi:hypothetical protein
MRGALERLQRTKEMLAKNAAQDFHGHRVNAINRIDAAIQELKLGIPVGPGTLSHASQSRVDAADRLGENRFYREHWSRPPYCKCGRERRIHRQVNPAFTPTMCSGRAKK